MDRSVLTRSRKICGQAGGLQQDLRLQALGRHRLQEGLLGLHPAQVSVGVLHRVVVVVPPADQPHGVLAAEGLLASLQVDVQVLGRVVVVHVKGHVELYAADGVHQLAHGLPLDHHIEIGDDAGELAHLPLQGR